MGIQYLSGLKFYDEVRTVHLERKSEAFDHIKIRYRRANYDCNHQFAQDMGAKKVNIFTLIFELIWHRPQVVELNEPLFLRQVLSLSLIIFVIRACDVIFRRRTYIVSYAIENLPLNEKIRSISPAFYWALKRPVPFLLQIIVSAYDRIAFGTKQSMMLYERLFVGLRKKVELEYFAALEPPCPHCKISKTPLSLLFLGAFDRRKGILDLLNLWPSIVEGCIGAHLTIIGKGELADTVNSIAQEREDITIYVDPPRSLIHRELSRSSCLVLLSQSSSSWREQIGLPILEGLSHGCHIISNSETGMSEWLRDNGHLVIDGAAKATDEIINYIRVPPNPKSVIDNLPKQSGRNLAEEWMWRAD